jgi:hypothetical protein
MNLEFYDVGRIHYIKKDDDVYWFEEGSGKLIRKYGTSEGAIRGWDTRGRGNKIENKSSNDIIKIGKFEYKHTDFTRNINYPHNMGQPKLFNELASINNFQPEVVDQSDFLLKQLDNPGTQEIARENITENIKNNTDLGRFIEERIKLETALYEDWMKKYPDRIEKEKLSDLKSWDYGIITYNGVTYDNKSDLNDAINEDYKYKLDHPPVLYRLGNYNSNNIESYTSQEEGAFHESPGQGERYFDQPSTGYTFQLTYERMKNDGWQILGGVAATMGSPGEGEITLINTRNIKENISPKNINTKIGQGFKIPILKEE